jgi:hypothetical protein
MKAAETEYIQRRFVEETRKQGQSTVRELLNLWSNALSGNIFSFSSMYLDVGNCFQGYRHHDIFPCVAFLNVSNIYKTNISSSSRNIPTKKSLLSTLSSHAISSCLKSKLSPRAPRRPEIRFLVLYDSLVGGISIFVRHKGHSYEKTVLGSVLLWSVMPRTVRRRCALLRGTS